MHMKRILIVGAGGQIGSELTVYLRKIYGDHNVVATDMRECKALGEAGPFEVLNALDATAMQFIGDHRVCAEFLHAALVAVFHAYLPDADDAQDEQEDAGGDDEGGDHASSPSEMRW